MVQGVERYSQPGQQNPSSYTSWSRYNLYLGDEEWGAQKRARQYLPRQNHHRSQPSSPPPSPGAQPVHVNSASIRPDTLQWQMGSMCHCWTMSAHSPMTSFSGRQRGRVMPPASPIITLSWSQTGRSTVLWKRSRSLSKLIRTRFGDLCCWKVSVRF